MADLTQHGLEILKRAVKQIRENRAESIDLGHDTLIYKVPTDNPKKYTVRVDMEFDETKKAY